MGRGDEQCPRSNAWATAHGILLVPVTLAFAAIVPIMFFISPIDEDFFFFFFLFVRLSHAGVIISCCVGSWRAYLREAYRTGAVIGGLFLIAAIIRVIPIYVESVQI